MNASHLRVLASLAEDVIAIDGAELLGVTINELGDGSGRSVALVDTYQCGLEQQYRITSPAPANAAPWARVHRDWTVAVRVDDDWLDLEARESGLLDGIEVPS